MQNFFKIKICHVNKNIDTHTFPQFLSFQNVPSIPVDKSGDSFP